MDPVCAPHGRVAAATCRRCGVFLCDWCEKLTPDWGPGLCVACQRVVTRTQRRPPPRTWRRRLAESALVVTTVASAMSLVRALLAGPDLLRTAASFAVLTLSVGAFVILLRAGTTPR